MSIRKAYYILKDGNKYVPQIGILYSEKYKENYISLNSIPKDIKRIHLPPKGKAIFLIKTYPWLQYFFAKLDCFLSSFYQIFYKCIQVFNCAFCNEDNLNKRFQNIHVFYVDFICNFLHIITQRNNKYTHISLVLHPNPPPLPDTHTHYKTVLQNL